MIKSKGGFPGDFPNVFTYNTVSCMAMATEVNWVANHGHCSAGGARDAFVIISADELQNPDAVPRCNVELTEEDQTKLTNQGVHAAKCHDDLAIIRERFSLDGKNLDLLKVEVSKPGKELTKDYILQQLENFMKDSRKPGGENYSYAY